MTTERNLQAIYDDLYAAVSAVPSTEYVCLDLLRRLGEAESALTDYQIANGTFCGESI